MTKNTLKIVNTEKTEDKKEKQKALDAAISQIDQNYGKGSVMRLGQSRVLDIESISSLLSFKNIATCILFIETEGGILSQDKK